MPVDQQLRREHAPAVLADRDVDVRGPEDADERVVDRFDRPEVILALGVAEEAAVPLEILVEAGGLTAAGVHVRPGVVDLPDLDERVADRLARTW